MHTLVKILFDDDGKKVDLPRWHLAIHFGGANRTVCTGEVFGEGEGIAIYETKEVKRGVPCKICADVVKWHKGIKI